MNIHTTAGIDREAVRAAASLEELIGEHTALRGPRRDLRGRCPLHGGNNPTSLSVNAEEGVWHCKSCGAGGDVFDWVMTVEGVEFAEALRILADRYGVAPRPAKRAEEPWTVATYSARFVLPQDELREWGVADREDGGVLIAYRDEDGALLRNRVRLSQEKRWWEKGADRGGDGSYLYGLDRLDHGDGELLVVEGESDCHVAWHCGLRALGAPGQTIFKPAWGDHIPPGTEALYVLREPDGGLPETVAGALRRAEAELGLPDPPEVRAWELPQGDLADAWHQLGHNKRRLCGAVEAALEAARPVVLRDELDDLTQAEALLRLAEANTVELFSEAADRRPFAQVIDGEGVAVHEVVIEQGATSPYRAWLLRLYRETLGETPSGEATVRAMRQVQAEAAAGPVRELHVRAAWHDGDLLIDRGDEAWSAFRVVPEGW
ncbi:MAG: CHC2 zinc finger domain-containing protein, partial [Planctomycetota bacterium]|nr:CHC2 zinc finger domain-containing protein [Planctomycetota bacterium]